VECYYIGTQNGLDLLFNPFFSGVLAYFFLNQAIVLTQIISMVIIIILVYLTNKKA
jgi:drug/metabolite transporter (DMT)-like permease